MVKLAPKEGFAELPDAVLDKIKSLREGRANQIATRLNTIKIESAVHKDEWHRQSYSAEIQTLNNQLLQLKKTGGGSVIDGAVRGGMADIRMRMRRLPYEKFYLKSRKSTMGQQTWLIGLTREAIATVEGQHRGKSGQMVEGPRSYDMGKYFVAVLCEAIGTHNPTFHLMPQANPTTMARHMHHHVHSSMGVDGKTNPLDWTPANCFGSFQGAIYGTFLNADVPELFRMLYLFVSTLNPASPLLNLAQLPHVVEVKK
jgi:hypothetical protein